MRTFPETLALFNHALAALPLDRQPAGLYAPVKYVLSLGGKRIRPVLMLMAYDLYRDDAHRILPAALGLEMYHNYTLLHDDVMDKADMRRGKPTVHKVWNENTAILSGDAMLVLAYQLIGQAAPEHLKDVLDLFTETALEIGEGQQYDMDFESRMDVSEAEYIEMIRLKTSVLLACALKMGALQAGAPAADANLLYRFGENLGLAFQLQDDLLDVYGDPKTFGKNIGGDILEGKKTFMLINALRLATPAQRAELERWLATPVAAGATPAGAAAASSAAEKIAAVTGLYNQIGIRQLAEAKIEEYFAAAFACLDAVALPADRKQPLHSFALSLFGRQS
ncbi:MAG: polyprenyl synthetase family protein [Bacteroidaceae bacterium]|nr:polyprenyl synthetase family protein [Bacteroidaceae bacterium]